VLLALPAAAPVLDGSPSDAAWAAAPETLITTAGGANASAASVSLRAVYDAERVYFLVSWADPGPSWLRSAWQKGEDGSWRQLVSPENSGSDESVYDEDKLALLWPVNDSLPGFDAAGCGTACHAGDAPDSKPYGSMFTAAPGQLADLWNWKAARNVGQLDDLYLDATRFSPGTYWAGFQSDPGEGGYYPNRSENGRRPAYMPADPNVKDAAPGYISIDSKVEFQSKFFRPGDRVAAFIAAPFTGDRGDIRAAWQYANGRWTLEFSRKLVTGSPYDVQFSDLSRAYRFGVATFDNTQIRHAFQEGSTELRFQQP
jgi:hypothetical protein